MTLQEDLDELDRAWAELKRVLLTDRTFHAYLAITYLTVVGITIMLAML